MTELPAALAERWRAPFTATRRPQLVRAGDALLLADGAGALHIVRPDPPALADWVAAPLPRGSFRPSSGDPLFVAHGGALLRAREDLTVDAIGTTGVDDASEVEALGLAGEGAVVAARGRVRRLERGRTVWETAAEWTPELADDRVIVGTDRDAIVLADARSGAVVLRLPRAGRRPFALAGGGLWLSAAERPALAAVALDGSPRATVPLAAPFPHLLLAAGGRAVACSDSLAIERIDLASARVERTIALEAPEAWPLLLAPDGRLVYRDASLALRVLDLERGGEPMMLAEGALTLSAHAYAGYLYVLEQSLEDPRSAAIRCFGPG